MKIQTIPILVTAVVICLSCSRRSSGSSEFSVANQDKLRSTAVALSVKTELEQIPQNAQKKLVLVTELKAEELEEALNALDVQNYRFAENEDQVAIFPDIRMQVNTVEMAEGNAKVTLSAHWGPKAGNVTVYRLAEEKNQWTVVERKVVGKS